MSSVFSIFLALAINISAVRGLYQEAINDSSAADKLVNATEKLKSQAAMRAYYGTGLALQAKHSWNPATKLSKAKDAATELNAAVQSSNEDLEIRFLRFSFEANAPSFLGLSSHIVSDKKWILEHLDKKHAIWPVIQSFLKSSDLLTAEEKKKI